MEMMRMIPMKHLSFCANTKHGAQYHYVQMQRYLALDATGGNTRSGSSGNGATRSGRG